MSTTVTRRDRPTQATARDRSRPRTHALLLVLLAAFLAVSGVPSPLYGRYAAAWHFSALTTTLVFSAYAVSALLGLLVAGPLTDSRGRRPVLLASAVGVLAGLVVFMTAHGLLALFVARALHGFSIGAAVVAAGAALIDIRPDDAARAGRLSGIAFGLGMGSGALGSALLAQLLPFPLVTPYVVTAVVVVAILVGLALMPETHAQPTRARLRIARPSVPAHISGDFGFSALGAAASWVVLGVYLSIFPGLAAAETGVHALVFGGVVVASMAVAGSVTQWLAQGIPAKRMALIGDAGMAVVMLASIPLVLSGHAALVIGTSVVLGVFFGMAFSGSLRHLNSVMPPEHRGGVISAFYLLCYTALGVPTVLAGAAATRWSLEHTYVGFAAVVALLCVVAAGVGAVGSRTRPVAAPTGVADCPS